MFGVGRAAGQRMKAMRRREFVGALGAAGMLPAALHAQMQSPLLGFLSTRSPAEAEVHTNAFRRGLAEMGFREGRNIAVEYRWAEGDYTRLPSLAADLTARPISVLVATGDPAARAARAVAGKTPVVFVVGEDPVRSGLVTSMNAPGSATGVNFFTGDLGSKRTELLHAIVPSAQRLAFLANPGFGTAVVDEQRRSVGDAARNLGCELVVVEASNDAGIRQAFAALSKAGVSGLVVQNDPFFDSRRGAILELSTIGRLPGIFHIREFPADGGLMSYGASLSDTYRQIGVYAGKILLGASPNDLPVLRPTKFELVINTRTARSLSIQVPQSLLIAADELID